MVNCAEEVTFPDWVRTTMGPERCAPSEAGRGGETTSMAVSETQVNELTASPATETSRSSLALRPNQLPDMLTLTPPTLVLELGAKELISGSLYKVVTLAATPGGEDPIEFAQVTLYE